MLLDSRARRMPGRERPGHYEEYTTSLTGENAVAARFCPVNRKLLPWRPLGHGGRHDPPLRVDSRAVRHDRGSSARQRKTWWAVERPPQDAQRHPVDPAHRSPVARAPRTVWQVEVGPRSTEPLASRRHVRSHPGAAAYEARRTGPDRPRPLVRGRHQHPGQPSGGRGRGEKRSPASPPTTPSAAPEAASAPSCI